MSTLYKFFLFLFLTFLPFQLGMHFWPSSSLVLGRRIDYLSPTFFITDAFFLITLLFFYLDKKVTFPRLHPPFYLAVVFVAANIIFATTPSVAVYAWIRVAQWFLLVVIVMKAHLTPWQLLAPLFIGVTLTVYLALNQFLAQQSIGGWWYFLGERAFTSETPAIAQMQVWQRLLLRPYGTFPHPNALSGYLLALVPLAFSLTIHTHAQWVFKRIANVLLILGIVLSFSRSSWIVALFCLAALVLLHKKRTHALFLLAVSVIGIFVLEITVGRFAALFAESETIRERIILAKAAITLWQTQPYLGIGLLNFIPQMPTVSSSPYVLQPVHNVYLLFLSELGAIGTGFIFFCIWKFVKKLGQAQNNTLYLVFFSIAILSLNDHYWVTIQQTRLLLAVLIGFALSVHSDTINS